MNWKGVAYYNRLINYLIERGDFPGKFSVTTKLAVSVSFLMINYSANRMYRFAGITPYANLYHYDLPQALEVKYKGLLSPRVV